MPNRACNALSSCPSLIAAQTKRPMTRTAGRRTRRTRTITTAVSMPATVSRGCGSLVGRLGGSVARRRSLLCRREQSRLPATATGTGGAAATVDTLATQAAVDTLRGGGNAVDAAVTAAAVLGVTEPFSSGIGGGGFMVVYRASDGKVTT